MRRRFRRRTRRPEDIRADAENLLQRAVACSGHSVTLMIADDYGRYVAASGPTRQFTGYDATEPTRFPSGT